VGAADSSLRKSDENNRGEVLQTFVHSLWGVTPTKPKTLKKTKKLLLKFPVGF
jgi:hypothetical protein